MQVKTRTLSKTKLSFRPKDIRKIGALICTLREWQKLTIKNVSEKTFDKVLGNCVSQQTISKLEKGDTRSPHWRSVVRIFEALGCEVTVNK